MMGGKGGSSGRPSDMPRKIRRSILMLDSGFDGNPRHSRDVIGRHAPASNVSGNLILNSNCLLTDSYQPFLTERLPLLNVAGVTGLLPASLTVVASPGLSR